MNLHVWMHAKRRPLDACEQAEEKRVREEHTLRMFIQCVFTVPLTVNTLERVRLSNCVLAYLCAIVSIL